MFVLTYRPVESPQAPALYEVLHDFQRENRAHTLALGRLDRAMTEGMLTALFGESVAPELGEEVYRVTEGNPFFIEEVSKGLAESGALTVGADGRWQAPARKRLAIPVNVKVAIEGRLHLMPPETQRALEAAAIRGPRFEEEIVRQATQMEETAVVEALEAAERAKIIEEIPGDGRRFTFTHNLIPATIVDEMRASQRRSLHARVAPALAALRPEEFEALAYHYRQGGETGRAADYLLKAGERAYALYALPETIDNYTTALELVKALNRDDAAARTLLRLGLVYSAASAFILGQLFEGLLEVDEATGVVPALARRWDVSDDGRRYTFHLRDGACWSDGSPLTAGDFEYAWKRNLGLGPGPSRLFLSMIAGAVRYTEGKAQASEIGVQALDDRTLDVRLEQPAGFFPLLLAHTSTYPLPRRVVEGSRQPWTDVENLVGNGPYRLTEWRPGERVGFGRNPAYRGLARGNVGRIEAPVIGDYGPLLELFDHDQLDGISLIKMSPGAFQQRVQSAYRRELTITPALSTLYLAFRADPPPLDPPPPPQ